MTGEVMLAEIREQGGLTARWAAMGGYDVTAACRSASELQPDSIVLVARGTSDNAADLARGLLEILGGFTVASASPSSITLYGTRPRPGRRLCVAISQSGQSPDLIACTEAIRASGALAIVITNDPASPLAAVADHLIPVDVGVEQAVAATKTFLGEALALHDLATGLSGVQSADRPRLSAAISAVLDDAEGPIADAIDLVLPALHDRGHLVTLGRGLTTPIAREGALKIMETTGFPALGYSAADFEHGPVAIVREGTPVIAVSGPGEPAASLGLLTERLAALGACIVGIGPTPLPGISAWIRVHDCGPTLTPLACVIPLQLLTHRLALALGRNPDQPRGLTKVTRTR